MTHDGAFAPLESPDGKLLLHQSPGGNQLWKTPTEGGQATKVLEGLSSYISLAIVDGGVYFVLLQKPTSIQFLTFATNQIRSIANFQKPIEGPGLSGGLSVSRDGRWILCTQVDQAGSELMLVENFH